MLKGVVLKWAFLVVVNGICWRSPDSDTGLHFTTAAAAQALIGNGLSQFMTRRSVYFSTWFPMFGFLGLLWTWICNGNNFLTLWLFWGGLNESFDTVVASPRTTFRVIIAFQHNARGVIGQGQLFVTATLGAAKWLDKSGDARFLFLCISFNLRPQNYLVFIFWFEITQLTFFKMAKLPQTKWYTKEYLI